MCHPESCFRLVLCAVLKNGPFFVTPKAHVKCKVLTHKNLYKETKSKTKLLHWFICLFVLVMYVGILQVQLVKKTLLSALDMTTFAQRQSEACFRMAHFSERHKMPIWNMFQDGTRFRTAHNIPTPHISLAHPTPSLTQTHTNIEIRKRLRCFWNREKFFEFKVKEVIQHHKTEETQLKSG